MPRSSHEEFYAQSSLQMVWLNSARSSLPVALYSAILIPAQSSLRMVWLNSSAKLRKPISRNHSPTRLARPTRPTSPMQARSPMPCPAECKSRSSVKWGCALRVVEHQPLFYDSVVKDQLWLCHCHPEGFGADCRYRSNLASPPITCPLKS